MGGDKESVGEQERGEEVGDVTGASGWQGWAGVGKDWGRGPVTWCPSPHCWVRRSRKELKGYQGQSGAVGRTRVR